MKALLQCIKITTIIGQEINMKRDLYRFMKYRRELEQINEIGNRILKHQLKKKLKQEYEIQV